MALTIARDPVSSTVLLYFLDSDPTITGTADPNPEPEGMPLLVRTDVPSIYYKSGVAATAWTLIGSALAATAVYGKMSTDVNQVVADLAAYDLVLFDVQEYESSAGVVDVAADRFVAPVDGIYLITAAFTWLFAAGLGVDSTFVVAIQVNAAVSPTAEQTINIATGGNTPGSNLIASSMQLAAGDLVTIRASQTSGAAQEIAFAEATIQRVG